VGGLVDDLEIDIPFAREMVTGMVQKLLAHTAESSLADSTLADSTLAAEQSYPVEVPVRTCACAYA
jgi:hypothetical protein